MNKVILNILKWLLNFSAQKLWDYIDKNKDGKLSQEELSSVVLILKSLLKKTKEVK